MVDFCIKMLYMMRGVTFSFFFYLENTKYLSPGRIFFPGGFQVFGRMFGFFVVMDWFSNVSGCFFRCFGSKWIENMIFRWKHDKPRFSSHHNNQILSWRGDDVLPIKLIKKGPHLGMALQAWVRVVALLGQALGLAY